MSHNPAKIGAMSPDHEYIKNQQRNNHGGRVCGQVNEKRYQQSGADAGYSDNLPEVEDHQEAQQGQEEDPGAVAAEQHHAKEKTVHGSHGLAAFKAGE